MSKKEKKAKKGKDSKRKKGKPEGTVKRDFGGASDRFVSVMAVVLAMLCVFEATIAIHSLRRYRKKAEEPIVLADPNIRSEPITLGEPAPEPEKTPPEPMVTFVLDAESGLFHLPGCAELGSVPDAREIVRTRQQLLDDGYAPCEVCNP